MKIITINLFILATFSGALFAHDINQTSKRNMIILLDQEGICENIGRPASYFLSCKFQSALQEQCAPILISASLVNAFIEKRKSIEQISSISNTAEQKAFNTYNAIDEYLNNSYKKFLEQGIDPIQSKQLMLEEVNEKFYSSNAVINNCVQENHPISPELQQALRSYLTRFDPEDWIIYTNNKSLYLFIPKKHIEKLQKNDPRPAAPGRYALDLPYNVMHKDLLSLKIDSLTKIKNVEDPAQLYFDSMPEHKTSITEQLEDFFITKSDESSPHSWNIVFSGHGFYRYVESTDSYAEPKIADLTISDFQNILSFFQNKINTNLFHFSTCYGGGKRLKMLFDDAGNPKYNFAIISDSISDGSVFCLMRYLKFPDYKGTLLDGKDITCDDHGRWHLLLDYGYKWEEFFQKITQHSFTDNLNWLYPTLMNITENLLTDISLLRIPNTTTFIPVLPDSCSMLNDAAIANKLKDGNNALVFVDRSAILVESSAISLPVIIENNKVGTPRVISLLPGNSSHYFKHIEFKKITEVLNIFWPINDDRFNRIFIIENILLQNNEDSALAKILAISRSQVQLRNVYIHTQHLDIMGNMMRIFFQTENGKAYMVVVNKVNDLDINVSLKGIHELSPEVAQIYLNRYNQLKEEILAKKS